MEKRAPCGSSALPDEDRHAHLSGGRPESDINPIPNTYLLDVAFDDVAEHGRTFVQSDVGKDIRFFAGPDDRVGVYGTRAARLSRHHIK